MDEEQCQLKARHSQEYNYATSHPSNNSSSVIQYNYTVDSWMTDSGKWQTAENDRQLGMIDNDEWLIIVNDTMRNDRQWGMVTHKGEMIGSGKG